MKQGKSPTQKKQDEYERDHRTRMENPHAFRKNWPKKKARVNRRARRKLDAMLLNDAETTTAKMKSVVRTNAIWKVKSGVMTLREMMQDKTEKRQRRLGPPFSCAW